MNQWRIQQGIQFLVESVAKMDLSKPIIVHAINVGEILKKWDVSEDVLIAGYLHDVIEDTRITYEDIDRIFGVYDAQIVEANTITEEERTQKDKVSQKFERTIAEGEDAVMIAAADLLDNIQNYKEYHPEEKWERENEGLKSKKEKFLILCEEYQDKTFYQAIKNISIN